MRTFGTLALVLVLSAPALAQYAPQSYGLAGAGVLDETPPPEARLGSNVIIDILATASPDTFWLWTGSGVTRMILSGNTPRFETYSEGHGLGKGGTSGLVWTDSILWASFAFDTSVGVSGAGGGLSYSRDDGQSWTWLPQPRDRMYHLQSNGFDDTLGYWPTTTNVDNISYDIALSDSAVWISSKGGGLRRHAYAADYTDFNSREGWRVIDTLVFEPDNRISLFHPGDPAEGLVHRPFSVIYARGAVWQGTAAGILTSTNEGRTWRQITSGNSGITGNFVTALAYNAYDSTLWAATWRAESSSEYYAVSKSTDGGVTWAASLTPAQVAAAIGREETVRAHSFGFDSSTVYVADDLGLWKSVDGGATWDLFDNFEDAATRHRFYEPQIYAVLVDAQDRLWVGGVDGLAMSADGGASWNLFQTAQPLSGAERPVDTYAYPNPWSPARFGPVKLRYTTSGGSVKITIYDFAMSKVAELPAASRPAGEQYEVWDGRKDGGIVANGTYFYKVEKPGGEVWGKLIVLD